jgi:hypothetical protein
MSGHISVLTYPPINHTSDHFTTSAGMPSLFVSLSKYFSPLIKKPAVIWTVTWLNHPLKKNGYVFTADANKHKPIGSTRIMIKENEIHHNSRHYILDVYSAKQWELCEIEKFHP